MRLDALKLAARNQIRTLIIDAGRITGAECQLTPDDHPVAGYTGQIFFSIHGGSIQDITPPGANYHHHSASFDVTVSVKTAHIAPSQVADRLNDVTLMHGGDNMHHLISRALIYDRGIALLTAANTLLSTNSVAARYNVGELIHMSGPGEQTPRGVEWWEVDPKPMQRRHRTTSSFTGRDIIGYSMTIRLTGAALYADSSDLTFA